MRYQKIEPSTEHASTAHLRDMHRYADVSAIFLIGIAVFMLVLDGWDLVPDNVSHYLTIAMICTCLSWLVWRLCAFSKLGRKI